MITGTVDKFFADQGCGFILPDDGGEDLFFRSQDLEGSRRHFPELRAGQRVSFERGPLDGAPRAQKIRLEIEPKR